MKLLIISAAFPPMTVAGEADHAFHLCQHLTDAGLDVHVLTTQGNLAANHLGMTVYPVMRHWTWSEIPRLARCMKQCSPDALLLLYSGGRLYNSHPMITFVPTLAKSLLPHATFVTQFENVGPPRWTSLLGRAIRKVITPWLGDFGTLIHTSDRLIVLSDHQRLALSQRFPDMVRKSVLIPPPPLMSMCPEENGVSRHRGRETLGVQTDDFLLIYFGYIYAGKGVETLLQAFHIVASYRNHMRLILVGGSVARPSHPSYGQEMCALSKQLGIDDKVIWTGAYCWDSDEASLYLRSADVCVLPFEDGVRLNNSSVAAAAAHGLPIITTQGTMVESPFIHQKNVILCPPQNPKAMAAAIETLMDTPDLRQRLRVGALQLTDEWFSWDRVIDRTIETFT